MLRTPPGRKKSPSTLRSVLTLAGGLILAAAPAPAAGPAPTIHDGLEAARADRASDPAAVAAFTRLAKDHGTPLYIYDAATIRDRFRTLREAFAARFPRLRVFYALKANTNLEIIRLLRAAGAGAEVVSEGEMVAATRAGAGGADILFTSSSKSPAEIDRAIRLGAVLNLDSLDEIDQVEAAAARAGRAARVSFRVNPGVDPHTLHQINTGISESKFGLHLENGLALEAYRRALARPHLKIVGAHCHIGSQITETAGYEETARRMFDLLRALKDELGIRVEFLDLGGGLGVPYRDGETVMTPADLASALQPIWREGVGSLGYEPELWLEPGRYFVAASGFLLARVNSVKTTPVKTFVNVNAGFNTLMRPAMYGAYHRVRVVGRAAGSASAAGAATDLATVDIAGDVCETGDILAADRLLPRPAAGDLVVILDAGAYGYSMASEYNARPLPAEVLVDGDTARVIRRRGTLEDQFRGQEDRGRP